MKRLSDVCKTLLVVICMLLLADSVYIMSNFKFSEKNFILRYENEDIVCSGVEKRFFFRTYKEISFSLKKGSSRTSTITVKLRGANQSLSKNNIVVEDNIENGTIQLYVKDDKELIVYQNMFLYEEFDRE